MNSPRIRTLCAIAAAAALAAAAWFAFKSRQDAAAAPEPPQTQENASPENKARMTPRTSIPVPAAASPRKRDARRERKRARQTDTDEPLSLSDMIGEASAGDDADAVFALAKKALAEGDADTRHDAVAALGQFGAQALPELVPFLADEDEDVRSDAMEEWSAALSEIDDDNTRISAAELAMKSIADEDALETISSEYIGIDEKLAVESLVRIIESGWEKGAAKARETYEFVTGEEWTGREAAEKWLAEEYNPQQ